MKAVYFQGFCTYSCDFVDSWASLCDLVCLLYKIELTFLAAFVREGGKRTQLLSLTWYKTAMLYGLPKEQILSLQRLQNAAARLVMGTTKFSFITPVLQELHWLGLSASCSATFWQLLVFRSTFCFLSNFLVIL